MIVTPASASPAPAPSAPAHDARIVALIGTGHFHMLGLPLGSAMTLVPIGLPIDHRHPGLVGLSLLCMGGAKGLARAAAPAE